MIMLFFRKIRTRLSKPKQSMPPWPPSAAWPLQDTFHTPAQHGQAQSPLFKRLSTELRIMIYQAVLSDPDKLLHICMNVVAGSGRQPRQRRVAHWRCTDNECLFPTWQHTCFGEERIVVPDRYSAFQERPVTTTEDLLLGLLLSCRRIYSESLVILYRDNNFHFRGGLSLPAFRESIPTPQWTALRHIHISTAYYPFYCGEEHFIRYDVPDTLPNWMSICEQLRMLPMLEDLQFDIMAYDPEAAYPFERFKTRILLSILEPIKHIPARSIEVELNVAVPDDVWKILEPVPFMVTFQDRPFNRYVYRSNHLHDAMEVSMPSQ